MKKSMIRTKIEEIIRNDELDFVFRVFTEKTSKNSKKFKMKFQCEKKFISNLQIKKIKQLPHVIKCYYVESKFSTSPGLIVHFNTQPKLINLN
jgi:hypothetical protein